VAALYGLWVAIQQFIPKHEPMPSTPIPTASTPPTAVSATSIARVAQPSNSGNQERREQSSTTRVPSASQSTYSTGAEVTLQGVTFKIVAAQLDDHRKEKPTLRFTIRMANDSKYIWMFDDKVCRLVVDGVPRAPLNGVGIIVPSHSAADADFVFPFSMGTKSAALKFWFPNDESETIPVDLPSD
jgi:hypothetical protein